MIPQDKIAQLIAYKHLLSVKQKHDILDALQTGNGVVIKPTRAQYGNGIYSMPASIGILLELNALTGKGLHVDHSRPTRSLPVYDPDTPKSEGGAHAMYLFVPPPFIGSWPKGTVGRGKKKKIVKSEKGRWVINKSIGHPTNRGLEQNSSFRNIKINL